ncbi:MAG: cobyric acid synthase [Lachnospiraceae bacterium]|nr:cobyric acid synthase [Lachnospiraceae bacterium]
MAYKLMIQGTMSSAGKSFIVTGLCRLFSDLGYKVAPFKSQNMALNSGVTFDGYEMGRAQIVQAEAARTTPDVRMNPVLLKPNSDIGSQVIVMGKPVGNMSAKEYYDYKVSLVPVIKDAFNSLEKEYDVIIVEGAGSPAEINLKANDIVNMGLAKMLDIPVLLVGDIDLGGVFAQLLGTLEWLDDYEKDYVKGLIINKFRGDVTLLKPGIEMLTNRTKKDVIGVVPYCKARIDEEDSVTVNLIKDTDCLNEYEKKIYIVRLPYMSNFTDFNPLKLIEGVCVKYINKVPDKDETQPDLIIIPGSKSTISDLDWLKDKGLDKYIISIADEVPVIGICGGNQILGNCISDPNLIEGKEYGEGLKLINQDTVIYPEKTLREVEGVFKIEEGFFACLNDTHYRGYEIHSGVTRDVVTNGNVFGTYIHGIFDSSDVTRGLMTGLGLRKEYVEQIIDYSQKKDEDYDLAAATIKESVDIKKLFEIMGMKL